MTRTGADRIGQYQVVGLIGAGGMGAVDGPHAALANQPDDLVAADELADPPLASRGGLG